MVFGEPCDVGFVVAELFEDRRVVGAEPGRDRPNLGRGFGGTGRRPWLAHGAEIGVLADLDDPVLNHLGVRDHLAAPEHRCGGHDLAVETREDFRRRPFGDLLVHDRPALGPVVAERGGGFEARVLDQLLAAEGAAHPCPFRV